MYTIHLTWICDWICKNRSYCPLQEVHFFDTNRKKDTSMHYQVSLPKWSSFELPASTGCFSPAHWQSVRVVWVLEGALERSVWDCKVLWCWIKTPAIFRLSFLAGYEPCVAHIKVYFTSSPSSDSRSDIFHESLARYPAPATLPLLSSPDTICEPTSVKRTI